MADAMVPNQSSGRCIWAFPLNQIMAIPDDDPVDAPAALTDGAERGADDLLHAGDCRMLVLAALFYSHLRQQERYHDRQDLERKELLRGKPLQLNFSRQTPECSGERILGTGVPESVPNSVTNASGDTDVAASNPELVCGVSLIVGSTFTWSLSPGKPAKLNFQGAALPVCDRQRLQLECLRQSY